MRTTVDETFVDEVQRKASSPVWKPQPHHAGWPGVLHGGAIAALFDCLTGWAAWLAFLEADGGHTLAMTKELKVRYLHPVGLSVPVHLKASVRSLTASQAIVDGSLVSEDKRRATCIATIVSRVQQASASLALQSAFEGRIPDRLGDRGGARGK